MQTSRIEFASEILMREGPERAGSQGVMALMGYSGGDASKGAAFNSSRSCIKSGLELFRMDSIGRAFLGGGLVSWGLQHPQSQQGEVRNVGNGCQLQQEGGTRGSIHCWDGCEPKAGHLWDSQMGLWHIPHGAACPAQLDAAASTGSPRGGI